MTGSMELLAEIELEKIGIVVANDAARSSFTVSSGTSLLALDSDLVVRARWPLEPGRGWHATSPERGLALISRPDQVVLVDSEGDVVWSFPHPPWMRSKGFESGCAWFDITGEPHAVVPDSSYEHCHVVRLDLELGRALAETSIRAEPAGIRPVHHRDGWVGLSEGEGQDATRTWWIRSAAVNGEVRLEVLDAGWDHWILDDVDPTGTRIITTPHTRGPLLVRSFPGLQPLRAIGTPDDDSSWDSACFARDLLVGRLIGDNEGLVLIDPDDNIHELSDEGDWIIPAAEDSFLTATNTSLRRWRITQGSTVTP